MLDWRVNLLGGGMVGGMVGGLVVWVGCVGRLCRCVVDFVWGLLVVWLFVYVLDVLDIWFVVLFECLIGW